MKKCDTCIYRNNVEQLKPCIIYQDNCEFYKSDDVLDKIRAEIDRQHKWLMQTNHTLYDIDIAFSGIKSFIDKHIGGDADESNH